MVREIRVYIRKLIVFAGVMSLFLVIFWGISRLFDLFFDPYAAGRTAGVTILAFALGIALYRTVENKLVGWTDWFLFQKKYDYRKVLKDASRGMSRIESLDHLLKLVVHFITMKMRVKNVAILSRSDESGRFELGYHRGYEKMFLEYAVESSSAFIQYLANEREPLETDMIQKGALTGAPKRQRNYDVENIQRVMQDLNAVCCIPSFLGRELRTVLVLGEKKSGDHYTDEDLNVLFTLAQESAIAIENARLFDEAVHKSSELQRINEQLEYSKGLLVKALSETEVANKQLQDTQVQLIHEQKMATLGRLAASVGHEVNNPLTILSMNVSRAILKYRKNQDLKVGDILDLFQRMEQNIGRIKAVVNTLTGLLKKSEKGKFEPLSLKLILEETLPLVQFQTYLDNLSGTEVEFDVPSNIPLIRGDLERLQEVFLNLFINAYHAMSGKRNRRIQVRAEADKENKRLVKIYFEDNGTGMTDETRKKIFNYGFTTKPPGRGSGMGLYMCKYIIELHGGDIRVESELGKGTTFVLTLPVYEEESSSAGDIHAEASN